MIHFVDKLFRLVFFAVSIATIGTSNFCATEAFSMSSQTPPGSKTIYGVPNSGWTSPEWNWGYASGTGHDCAAICRRKYSTRDERSALVDALVSGSEITDLEEVKLIMALAWQRGRWDGSDGGWGGYGDVLATMADARRYEEGSTGNLFLLRDMKARFDKLNPTDEDRAAMQRLNDEDDSGGDVDGALRSCSGLVLKAMGFVTNGL